MEASTAGRRRRSAHKDTLASEASTFCFVRRRRAERCRLQGHRTGWTFTRGKLRFAGKRRRHLRKRLRWRSAHGTGLGWGREAETLRVGAAKAGLKLPAAVPRQRAPRRALNTPTPFPGRKRASVFLAGQRLPGSWFRRGALTSVPVRGNRG